MIIVSNTSPINYLILIGQINLLPELFQQIIIPQAVYTELSDKLAPPPVQAWIAAPPNWLKIQTVSQTTMRCLRRATPTQICSILVNLRLYC
ncbi:hypothetical protein [Nostoc sp. NMS1]|uniref:hypothetical protein n=1 Tax=Nostoc sp. NMS1 TaxID=2815388 RepID=UPI0025E71873|nr:hypothetical protein [Nostoc sp. NMS1]